MNVFFDGRVIQDHFPGIGRYAWNLLKALPGQLGPDDRVTILHDPSAKNTRYDVAALAPPGDPRMALAETRAPIFGPSNALRNPAPRGAVSHFPYYVRPYFGPRPTVTTLYDAISFLYPALVPSARARFLIRALTELAVRRADAFLAISQATADDMARLFPPLRGKITVTPLAADAVFTPAAATAGAAAARARYGLPERFALYLASNKPHKNLVRLVEAWKRVSEGGDDTPLVIAGHQDPRFPDAPARATALGIGGRVRFIGDVPQEAMAGLYGACALFVYPSLYEGFGLTPLEALACGSPVACANTSSLPEVAGDAALLFDPNDPGAIAEACLRVLGDPSLAARFRAAGPARAAAFTWEACARETVNVYRKVWGWGLGAGAAPQTPSPQLPAP